MNEEVSAKEDLQKRLIYAGTVDERVQIYGEKALQESIRKTSFVSLLTQLSKQLVQRLW